MNFSSDPGKWDYIYKFLLELAFYCPTFPLDQQHLQRETWETSDVPSIHNAATVASDPRPERTKGSKLTKINLLIV